MKRYSTFLLLLIILSSSLLCFNQQLFAQSRANKTDNEYYRLAWRALQAQSFIQHQILPSSDSLSTALVGFSLSYDLLQFKKNNDQFDSQILISIDVFKTTEEEAKKIDELERKEQEAAERDRKRGRRPNANVLRENQLAKLEELIPVETVVFRDTISVETYEATTSRAKQFTGNFLVHLAPGIYRYRIELRQNGDPSAQQSRFRTLRIRKRENAKKPLNILIGEFLEKDNSFSSNNLDGKIPFGKAFDVLFWLPDSIKTADYTFQLKEKGFASIDSLAIEPTLLSLRLSEAKAVDTLKLDRTVSSDNKKPIYELNSKGYNQYLLTIDGVDLPNSRFSFEIVADSATKPLISTLVSSYWADMPLALYNVDLAIEMLRFIIPEKNVQELSRGDNQKKIDAFEQFWKEKDPTPDTDFNELMTEYYRRIDYAFENYSSPSTPGFENDMGQYYIKLGPPIEKKRTLLGNNQTMVQWFYPQVELIFQSTSGFGDYQLIERKARS